MDIKECYRKMGGNFDDVMQRLGNESFIQRFVIRFLDDPSFQMIKDGIEKKDAELAFRGVQITFKRNASSATAERLFHF